MRGLVRAVLESGVKDRTAAPRGKRSVAKRLPARKRQALVSRETLQAAQPPVQASMFEPPSPGVPSPRELDEIMESIESQLRGEVPEGYRVPSEGDQRWMGR